MVSTDWPAALVFVMLVLSISLYGLTVSGHFPSEHRAQALRTGSGAAILWGTMAMTAMSAVYAIVFAAQKLPWYVAIIGGGAAVLVAPLLLQPLPDSFVDGRRGLVAFAVLALAVAGLGILLG